MSAYNQRRQQVQNLLSGLSYAERSTVEMQVLQLLHQINSLRPRIDNYVFNDGTQQQLFKLDGTIPIHYRGNQYNIPVAVWLPLNFPSHCPICYVTPVAGMKIKPKHMHVDSQGLVYHPYLHSWNSPNSNLVELVGLLCSVFGKDPPLYASKQRASVQPSQRPQQPAISKSVTMPHVSRPVPRVVQQPVVAQTHSQNDNKAKLERQLRESLQKIYDKENHRLNALSTAQKQLENHTQTINDIQQNQNKEKEMLLQRRQTLQIQSEAVEQWLAANEKNEEIDVESIVCASDTWSKQCMDAVAMDFAITDCMLELDKCLEDETIKLNTYLKQMSKIAREQFNHRALAKAVYKKQTALVMQHQR